MLRTFFGFIIAILLVSFFAPMAFERKLFFYSFGIFAWTTVVVAFLVPFTAFPIYKVVTNKFGFSYKSVVLAAALSTSLVSVFFVFHIGVESSIVNGKVLVENGSITLFGYLVSISQLLLMAFIGVLAGTAFYFIKVVGNQSVST